MSGIFGVLNRNGAPVESRVLEFMAQAMAYWGPDGSSQWTDGPVGLGHLALHTTPESVYETHPLISACGNFVMVSHARLDNRRELFELLGVPLSQRRTIPDNALILKAWETWGKNCTSHLIGDWVFALFDQRSRSLFLAKDHFGISGIYYYETAKFFVFSSSLKGLFALARVPRKLNRLCLAKQLTGITPDPGEIVYADIYQIPPAHWMEIRPDGSRKERYWGLENTPMTRFKSDHEYVDALMEIYTEAVNCRLRSIKPVGSHLSGGLDSGSVAALAARKLDAQGCRLKTYSSVPCHDVSRLNEKFPSTFLDESEYIRSTAAFSGNMETCFVPAQNFSPTLGMQNRFEIDFQPIHGAANAYWMMALMEQAKADGMGVLLTGQRGNATLSWAGWPRGKSLGLRRHLGMFRKALALRAVNATRGDGRFSKLIHSHALHLLKKEWDGYSRLQRDFLASRFISLCRAWRKSFYPFELQIQLIRPRSAKFGSAPHEIGAWFGLEIRDPTADKRVLEFCYSLPNNQYRRKGEGRYLMRRAMSGILPDKVRLNSKVGIQSGDIGARLLQDSRVGPMLERYYGLESFNEIFDVNQIKAIQKNNYRELSESRIIARTLMVGMFLELLES